MLDLLLRTGSSEAKPVQRGQRWRGTNFALEQIGGILDDGAEIAMSLNCADDLTGVVQTICSIITNILYLVVKIIVIIWMLVSGFELVLWKANLILVESDSLLVRLS